MGLAEPFAVRLLATVHLAWFCLLSVCLWFSNAPALRFRWITDLILNGFMVSTLAWPWKTAVPVLTELRYFVLITQLMFAAGRLMRDALFLWIASIHSLPSLAAATVAGLYVFFTSDLPAEIGPVDAFA